MASPSSIRPWVWIVLGVFAAVVLCLFGMAGAGVYFVAHHIDAHHATSSQALRQLDAARQRFQGRRPLLELDENGRPRETQPLVDMPTSPVRPSDLVILAWDPDKERTVKVWLPFWLLKLGRRRVDILDTDKGFDIQRLNLDMDQLERIGPAFVLDLRTPSGQRVLIWTQ